MNLCDIIKAAEALKNSYDVISKLIDIKPCELVDDDIKGLSDAKDFIEGILEEWGYYEMENKKIIYAESLKKILSTIEYECKSDEVSDLMKKSYQELVCWLMREVVPELIDKMPAAGLEPVRRENGRRREVMNNSECIEALQLILNCMDDKLQGERDKITKLIDLKPSSFEFVLKTVINLLTVEAEPVSRGWWIVKDGQTAKCSCCGWWQRTTTYYLPDDIDAFSKCYRFCTACGVEMDGGGDHGKK